MKNNQKNLNVLLQYLHDSFNGLSECAEQAREQSFKDYLLSIAGERRAFISELETVLNSLGSQPIEYGTVIGPLHRLFIDIKAMMSDHNAESIKQEILRGDESLIEAYSEALFSETDENIKALLNQQLHQIHKSLLRITEVVAEEIPA